VQHLNARDAKFFAKSLPKSEHWHAYHDFKDRIAFVDIETTGLSPHYNHLTVVGIYDGKNVRRLCAGSTLTGLPPLTLAPESELIHFQISENSGVTDRGSQINGFKVT